MVVWLSSEAHRDTRAVGVKGHFVENSLTMFVGKGSRMRMQSLPGSLFPSPREPGDKASGVYKIIKRTHHLSPLDNHSS